VGSIPTGPTFAQVTLGFFGGSRQRRCWSGNPRVGCRPPSTSLECLCWSGRVLTGLSGGSRRRSRCWVAAIWQPSGSRWPPS